MPKLLVESVQDFSKVFLPPLETITLPPVNFPPVGPWEGCQDFSKLLLPPPLETVTSPPGDFPPVDPWKSVQDSKPLLPPPSETVTSSPVDEGAGPTTLMLHGIPSKARMHALFPIFEAVGFPMQECFDFFYMPHRCGDRGLQANFGSPKRSIVGSFETVGAVCAVFLARGAEGNSDAGGGVTRRYMFLNCVTPEIAQQFALAIKHHPLGRKEAMCERVYCSVAKVQGVQANISAKSGTVKNFMLVKKEDNQWHAVKCSALDYAA
jgi:hypothetical protein